MDIANVALYAATEAIAASLLEKTGPPHNLDDEEIQKVGSPSLGVTCLADLRLTGPK